MDTRARPLMQTHLPKKQKKKTNKQKQEDEQQRRTKDASIRQCKAKKVKSQFKTGSEAFHEGDFGRKQNDLDGLVGHRLLLGETFTLRHLAVYRSALFSTTH